MIDRWFIVRDSKEVGPYSSYQLRDLANSGTLIPDDFVRRSDMTAAIQAKCIKDILINLADKPPAASSTDYGAVLRDKSQEAWKHAGPLVQRLAKSAKSAYATAKQKINSSSESDKKQVKQTVDGILGLFLLAGMIYGGYWLYLKASGYGEHAKLAAFRKIVDKLHDMPDPLSGRSEFNKYSEECRKQIKDFENIPFDVKANVEDAKTIVKLYDDEVQPKYSGEIATRVADAVIGIKNELLDR